MWHEKNKKKKPTSLSDDFQLLKRAGTLAGILNMAGMTLVCGNAVVLFWTAFFSQHIRWREKNQNLQPTPTTSKRCTWVSGDRTVGIFHIHNPGCLLPTWSILHFEGKHAANFLHQLLSFLQENREGFLIVPQTCSKDIRWHGNSPSSQSIQWIFILFTRPQNIWCSF